MASRSSHNKNNAGVKRILQEARELAVDPSLDYHAAPLEDDIFDWHCTMRGPAGTDYEGGIYHFRIQLPSEYPFRPPSIMMLTPNGRFELNTKICISFTSYHEELWQPAWGVRTAIIGLQGFFPLKGEAAVGVGAMECSSQERKRLAKLSRSWTCSTCGQSNAELLPDTMQAGSEKQAALPPVQEETKSLRKEPGNATDVPHILLPTRIEAPMQPPVTAVTVPLSSSQRRQTQVHSQSLRPPLVLDGAIAICLTMLLAILCKRLF